MMSAAQIIGCLNDVFPPAGLVEDDTTRFVHGPGASEWHDWELGDASQRLKEHLAGQAGGDVHLKEVRFHFWAALAQNP